MGILLAILKIIGIILLVILGLVILILLLVLFCPIGYRVEAVHNEELTEVNVTVRYLIVKAAGTFKKGEGLSYYAKILFYQILSSDDDEKSGKGKKKSGEKDKKKKKKGKKGENEEDELTDTGSDEDTPETFPDAESTAEADTDTDTDTDVTSDDEIIQEGILPTDEELELNLKEQKKLEKKKKKEAKKAEKARKKQEKKNQPKEPLSDKIDNVIDKIYDTLDNLNEKYEKAITKLDHIIQFLDRDYVQRTIKRAFKIIKRLFGTVKPKKSKGYLRLGLGSSADTGMILGKISAFYPLYGRWLEIDPDFYNKVIEANLDLKGRIYLFRIVGPAIRLLLTRDFWKTKKLASKI